MKGKIFPESSNIYQDQAKILFSYYQQMAENIVNEEERIEGEIAKLNAEKKIIEDILSSWWNRLKLWFSAKLKKTRNEVESLKARIAEFQKMHGEIFRDYKVTKLGVAYVPIADQIKYENKSFVVDHTGLVPESEVKLQLSRQNDLLIKTISDLEGLSSEAPIVESSDDIEQIDTDHYSKSIQQINQHDYFGKLERSLRTVSYCMDDLDITSVQLPLVANESSYLDFLREFATSEIPENAPVFEAFDTRKYDEQISKFKELNKLKDSLSRHTQQFEDVLKGLMITMANSVQAISAMKIASADKMIFESNKLLFKILKSPYNHYSPILEASEIERIRLENFNYSEAVTDYVPFQLKESSKVKYNLISGLWTAEDGGTTNFPFGVHQIHEEIVAPVVQNLMNETRIERLKIYNHIKDQKISYLNKWHQDTEDFYGRNRAESADLINLMRASLRDYIAAYNTLTSLKKTEESMAQSGGSLDATVVEANDNSADVLAAFELQSKEFQNVQIDFETYMERLKEDIDVKAEKFEHIDYYDALLRDGNAKEIAVAADEVHSFDPRRKPLISVNPLFAKSSELPPAPHVDELTYEHIALNLPAIAKSTLNELDGDDQIGTIEEEHAVPENNNLLEETSLEETTGELLADSVNIDGEISEELSTEPEVELNDDQNSELEDAPMNIVEETPNDEDNINVSESESNETDDTGTDNNNDNDDDNDEDDLRDDDDLGDDDDNGPKNSGGGETTETPEADNITNKMSGLFNKAKGFGDIKGKFGI
jgi:hypothetical protein